MTESESKNTYINSISVLSYDINNILDTMIPEYYTISDKYTTISEEDSYIGYGWLAGRR